jgi:hypothetical protein
MMILSLPVNRMVCSLSLRRIKCKKIKDHSIACHEGGYNLFSEQILKSICLMKCTQVVTVGDPMPNMNA